MAKEQMIKTFKEGNKIYIVIENPSSDVESKIDGLFGNIAGDLATILKPETKVDSKEEASKIDAISLVESGNDAVSKVLPNKDSEDPVSSIENEKKEPVNNFMNEDEIKEEPSKIADKDTIDMLPKFETKEKAQSFVRHLLAREDASGDEFEKRPMLYIMFLHSEPMKARIKAMSEAEAVQVWESQQMREKAIQFSGYKPEQKRAINWV